MSGTRPRPLATARASAGARARQRAATRAHALHEHHREHAVVDLPVRDHRVGRRVRNVTHPQESDGAVVRLRVHAGDYAGSRGATSARGTSQ